MVITRIARMTAVIDPRGSDWSRNSPMSQLWASPSFPSARSVRLGAAAAAPGLAKSCRRNGISSVNENTSSDAAIRLNRMVPAIRQRYGVRNRNNRPYIARELRMLGGPAAAGTAGSGRADSVTREMYSLQGTRHADADRANAAGSLYIPHVRLPRQPFALDAPSFAFASIANFAARAPLGGAREIALAAYVTARMADDVRGDTIPLEGRQSRAANARRWLSSLTIAEPVRRVFTDLIAATEADAPAAAAAVRRVIEVTAPFLDGPSRLDLDRLAQDLDAQTQART